MWHAVLRWVRSLDGNILALLGLVLAIIIWHKGLATTDDVKDSEERVQKSIDEVKKSVKDSEERVQKSMDEVKKSAKDSEERVQKSMDGLQWSMGVLQFLVVVHAIVGAYGAGKGASNGAKV
jgi:cell division protein FtsB